MATYMTMPRRSAWILALTGIVLKMAVFIAFQHDAALWKGVRVFFAIFAAMRLLQPHPR